MQDLIKQEEFELEVLDRLNSKKLLGPLIFGGGTMLRLCFGLNRYSVDLDFWLGKAINKTKYFNEIRECLSSYYEIKDSADKFFTLLFEIKSAAYPRSLKIEIRKELKNVKTEEAIAFSKYSNLQIILRVLTPKEMMRCKIEAFLSRKEIRDAFDLEFLVKKGVVLDTSKNNLVDLLNAIDAFTKVDYTVKLSSLLEKDQRRYYTKENFKILKNAIRSVSA